LPSDLANVTCLPIAPSSNDRVYLSSIPSSSRKRVSELSATPYLPSRVPAGLSTVKLITSVLDIAFNNEFDNTRLGNVPSPVPSPSNINVPCSSQPPTAV